MLIADAITHDNSEARFALFISLRFSEMLRRIRIFSEIPRETRLGLSPFPQYISQHRCSFRFRFRCIMSNDGNYDMAITVAIAVS